MKLDTLTISQIHSWRPCNMAAGESYSRANLRKLFGGNSIPVLDVLSLPIPPADRLWVILRTDILEDRELRLLACDFAQHVLKYFERKFPSEIRPRECIRIAREFANGKASSLQLNAARDAARAAAGAAWDAVEDAGAATRDAWVAAWAAAWASTWAAAGAATRDAARAAGDGARDAARDAARAAGDAGDAGDAVDYAEGIWQCNAAFTFLKKQRA